MEFSKRLVKLLEEIIRDTNNYLAFELQWLSEIGDDEYVNKLDISSIDISENDYSFDVVMSGEKTTIKVGKFIRAYFDSLFTDYDITTFTNLYNASKNGYKISNISNNKNSYKKQNPNYNVDINSKPIVKKAGSFNFNPKDVRSTFLSLVSKTYPHGHEEELLEFLPELEKDEIGNYYKIIGENPTTMFTSHLDTADRNQVITNLYTRDEDGDEIIHTDGTTILGADDKSGVAVLLYMMEHNIPGIYYFFIGEERGGIGSHALANIYETVGYLSNVKRCISFDRRDCHSIITEQVGGVCCSDVFADALCDAYNKSGLSFRMDPTGIYTDSASFIDLIPECTNVSVGYYSEHTGKERQNMTFLIKLCEASVKIDWDSLPISRKLVDRSEVNRLFDEKKKKYKSFLTDIKDMIFGIELDLELDNNKVYLTVDLENNYIDTIYDNLNILIGIMGKHRISKDVEFGETFIKIELK